MLIDYLFEMVFPREKEKEKKKNAHYKLNFPYS